MVLYGGRAPSNYSSQAVDGFKAWEDLYNKSTRNNPEWYTDENYTRTECEYLGYECWEYKKINGTPGYDDTVYRVVKSDNTCLYARAGASLAGHEVTAVKDMYYEDTLPIFDDTDNTEYNWRKTHCVVNEIGTADEQLYKTEMTFSTEPPEKENAAGYRFYVVHSGLVQGSATPTYHFYGRYGYDDHSWNFDIIPNRSNINGYDRMDEDGYSVTLEPRKDDNYDFDHWEKYDWETGTWSEYNGPLKFNYVVAKRDENGDRVYDENGYGVYVEDHRLTDIMYFRGIYNLKTRHIKVVGGTFNFNGEKVTEADVPHGTVISLNYDSDAVPDGYRFDGFRDTDGNELYYQEYSSITVNKDMTYTAAYTESAFSYGVTAEVKNGEIFKDGEAFNQDSFKPGTEITLTTDGYEGYPYFLGWYIMDGKSGEYVFFSKETTLNHTVNDDIMFLARWSNTETEPKHNITVINGFVRGGYKKLAVSEISVAEESDIQVIKGPTNPLKIKQWVLTGKYDDGEEYTEYSNYSEDGNGFYISEYANDGKGYPWNITITGEKIDCAEHIWDDGVITVKPTYTSRGEKLYTCTVCGEQHTEHINTLSRYCVHACTICGGCTLPHGDNSCDFGRCICETGSALPKQEVSTIDFSHNGTEEITPRVYTVSHEENTTNAYIQYVLTAAEGYDIAEIYDISFIGKDGAEYNGAVTVTLTVGKKYAQAISDGRMNIIHITDNGNEIYGVGNKAITADPDAGTVTFTADSFSPFVLAESTVSYYGRSALAKLSNSKALLYAYDRIVEGVEKSEAEISVYNGTTPITEDEFKTVLDAYRYDHTEHFWLGNSYGLRYIGTTLEFIPIYIMSGEALETAKARFDAAAAELLRGITGTMSEYEREKELHDRLAARVSYVETGNAHNAYGAIVEGLAVCEGYAKAYQYLLQRAGLQSFIVTGTGNDPSTETPVGHAWNIVRIDGKYYHVDLTWDDQGINLFYAYFNKTDAAIKKDHDIDETAYELPVCNSEDADYYTKSAVKMSDFDAEVIGAMLENGGGKARIYLTGDKAAFITAFKENILTLAGNMGITGTFVSGSSVIGDEYIFFLYKTGDVNCDGKVDILDLIRLKKYLAKAPGIEIIKEVADLSGDKSCDAIDLSMLRKNLLGV